MGRTHTAASVILALFCAACPAQEQPVHYGVKSDDPAFYGGFFASASGSPVPEFSGTVRAGITSHHALAGNAIARFFSGLRKKAPGTVIILAPNHLSRGRALVALSRRPWKTPWGLALPDESLADKLSSLPGAAVDEEAFEGEHSVGALVPFIRHYLPGSRILPVLLNYRLTWEEAEALGKLLAGTVRDSDIVILSADFVHGKTSAVSMRLDTWSEKVIREYARGSETGSISHMACDCRKGVVALFRFLRDRGRPSPLLLDHFDSSRITGGSGAVTSYFFYYFISR